MENYVFHAPPSAASAELSDDMKALMDRKQQEFKEDGSGRCVTVVRDGTSGQLMLSWETSHHLREVLADQKCKACE